MEKQLYITYFHHQKALDEWVKKRESIVEQFHTQLNLSGYQWVEKELLIFYKEDPASGPMKCVKQHHVYVWANFPNLFHLHLAHRVTAFVQRINGPGKELFVLDEEGNWSPLNTFEQVRDYPFDQSGKVAWLVLD